MLKMAGTGMQNPVQGRVECCQLQLPTAAIGLCQHLMPSRKSIQCKKVTGLLEFGSQRASGIYAPTHDRTGGKDLPMLSTGRATGWLGEGYPHLCNCLSSCGGRRSI